MEAWHDSRHGDVGHVAVHRPAAVGAQVVDDAGVEAVHLQADPERLLVDGHQLGGGAHEAGRVVGGNHVGAVLHCEEGREVDGAGKLRGARLAPRARRDADLGEHARVVLAARLRDEVVREGLSALSELADEHALAKDVAAVLLDDQVIAVGRSEPVQPVDVLEGLVHRVAVVHHGLVPAVGGDAFAAELDLVHDGRLALHDGVDGRDADGECGEGALGLPGGGRGQAAQVHEVGAHVARSRALDEARVAAGVLRVVLHLLSALVRPHRRPVAHRSVRRGGLLELPRVVRLEVVRRAVPHPVDGEERAVDHVALGGSLVELVAHGGGVVGDGEAVHLAEGQAIAREEVVGGLAAGVEALDSDVDARGDDVVGVDPRHAVRARLHDLVAMDRGVDAMGAIVAGD
mmetsp:Transcript_12391/g.52125  ORF Transcript_12391/g.52125 Transcript_12391/m.52125 type:complete len:403 (+) Transcript_12391:183-1391(+)